MSWLTWAVGGVLSGTLLATEGLIRTCANFFELRSIYRSMSSIRERVICNFCPTFNPSELRGAKQFFFRGTLFYAQILPEIREKWQFLC